MLRSGTLVVACMQIMGDPPRNPAIQAGGSKYAHSMMECDNFMEYNLTTLVNCYLFARYMLCPSCS